MFEIELLNLINEYKRISDEYRRKQIQNSLSNLILEHKEEYDKFMNGSTIDIETKQILRQCEKKNYEYKINKEVNESDSSTDVENIKNLYKQWLSYYESNNRVVNEECNRIVDQILNFYMLTRFDILQKLISIEDTQDYEAFKNHIKNKIRLQFLQKIDEYIKTENYEKMFFLKKLRKKNEINLLLDNLGQYKFDRKKFEEVLK